MKIKNYYSSIYCKIDPEYNSASYYYLKILFFNNSKIYFRNRLVHRDNGPAVEYHDDSFSWYINGEYMSPEEYWQLIKRY